MKTLIIAGLLTSLAAPAFAHAHLLAETPADKAAVGAPTSLTLSFSEGVTLTFTGVTVTGPDKASVALGTASLGPKDDKVLNVPVTGPLAPGLYTVDWHALATDGHKTTGSYSFTVK